MHHHLAVFLPKMFNPKLTMIKKKKNQTTEKKNGLDSLKMSIS